MLRDDCVFCTEIIKERNGAIVYEDRNTIAFMDYAPVEVGHVLVIPKTHFENIFDIKEDSYLNVHTVAKFIAPAILEALGADALNIGQNNGPCANQIIMHYHLHMIPRFCEDGSGESSPEGRFARRPLNWSRKVIARSELEKVADGIRIKIGQLF